MACAGAPRFHRVCFVVEVLGGIEMVSMALATLDLVGHDGARPGFPAVFLEGHRVLSYGELAGLVGGCERVPAGEIYREMALLLGTSGSTGSPKTVRLSYSGLAANTAAVIGALGSTAAERAPTTLPSTHAYGLSVLNSHLLAGAGVVLGGRPPLSLAMWDHLVRSGATSFAAVPVA
jgi:acyl-coenzyme A synthetase/AMP-(fatty) acid ligase